MDRNFETLFDLHVAESRASLARERIASIEAVFGFLDLSGVADADIVEAELIRTLDSERATLATLERRLRSVGAKERLALVEHAIETCAWSEATKDEEEELKAEASLLRAELDSDYYARKSWLQASVF